MIFYDMNVIAVTPEANTINGKIPLYFVANKGQYDETALFLATLNNHASSVRLLLKNGADITIPNNKGITPPQLAKNKRFSNIVDLFINFKSSSLK